jgi:hypothetical protein
MPELLKVLRYLTNEHDVDLVIKSHPRSPNTGLPKWLESCGMPRFVASDSEETSFELISKANIVLCTTSAAMFDALLFLNTLTMSNLCPLDKITNWLLKQQV